MLKEYQNIIYVYDMCIVCNQFSLTIVFQIQLLIIVFEYNNTIHRTLISCTAQTNTYSKFGVSCILPSFS